MHVPITTVALILLTLTIILLRVFWFRLPAKLHHLLVYAAIAMILLRIAFVVSGWSTTSDRMNALLNWCAVAGYELMIVLFTLYRPKWLTTISAAILLIPVFASSILMPLTNLFDETTADIRSIGNHLIYERSPWEADPGTKSTGVDLLVYYRPPLAPFLRHKIQRAAFNNDQCNADVSFAAVEPDRKHLRFHCPAAPSKPNGTAIDLILPIH
ncbi:MAG: hypothetical protein JWQ42_4654 [Edaphobacter sp.]|nr:hypothetical protein [Edaphobacter sp.]